MDFTIDHLVYSRDFVHWLQLLALPPFLLFISWPPIRFYSNLFFLNLVENFLFLFLFGKKSRKIAKNWEASSPLVREAKNIVKNKSNIALIKIWNLFKRNFALLKVNESRYIVLFVVSTSIKKHFLMDFVICQYLPFLKIFSIAFANIIFPQHFINKFYQYLSFLNIFFNRFYPLEKCWVTPHCDSLTLRTQTNICPGQTTLNNEILFSIVFSNIFSTMFEKL